MSISASSVTLAAWSSSPDGTGLRRPQEYARGAKYRLTPLVVALLAGYSSAPRVAPGVMELPSACPSPLLTVGRR